MNTMGAIHAALRARDIDKEDARERFERITGKSSLKAMSEAQRHKVLDDLNSDGRKAASKGSRTALKGPYAKKLQALWIAGWNLGLVRNRDDKALLAFVKRQTGLEHTQFLHDAANAAKVIEALKSWLAREGGVDWYVANTMPEHARLAGFKVACAQIAKLHPHLNWGSGLRDQLIIELIAHTGVSSPRELQKEPDWIPVMNALGKQLRARRKAAA
jgi:phage gp16-like protein